MDKRFETPASPFTHCGASTQRIMLDVIIDLPSRHGCRDRVFALRLLYRSSRA